MCHKGRCSDLADLRLSCSAFSLLARSCLPDVSISHSYWCFLSVLKGLPVSLLYVLLADKQCIPYDVTFLVLVESVLGVYHDPAFLWAGPTTHTHEYIDQPKVRAHSEIWGALELVTAGSHDCPHLQPPAGLHSLLPAKHCLNMVTCMYAIMLRKHDSSFTDCGFYFEYFCSYMAPYIPGFIDYSRLHWFFLEAAGNEEGIE